MLVVGSAPCVYDDVKRALAIRPFASLLTVNGACAAIENVEHMLCGHEEKTAEFVRARLNAFPGKPLPRVHATFNKLTGTKTTEVRVEEARQRFPQVSDWWAADVHMGAGSAGKAIGIAKAMGFSEVILCGCPMDGSGYFPGEGDGFDPARPGAGGIKQSMNCLRIGDGGLARGYPKPGTGGREWMLVQETRIVRGYREAFRKLSESELKGWVYSMSGFTRDCVGEPPKEIS
jgi:hypothetical protein